LGNILNGNKENCTSFSTLSIVTDFGSNEQPMPALSRLLIVALNSKDPSERSAAVRVFKVRIDLTTNVDTLVFLV
jgi:hypothetical protein